MTAGDGAPRLMPFVREDIHIRAVSAEVYGRISALDTIAEWLPPVFSGVEAGGRSLAFRLALPLHSERAALDVATDDPPALFVLAGHGEDGAGALDSLTWALHAEGERNVHLTLEAAYTPAAGLLGWLLEPSLHRPLRRQALRDALWRLKQVAEGRGPQQR